MKVFISHSLPRSQALAVTLEGFVRRVVPGTEPWVSESGIDKGARFMSEIRDNLRQSSAGIVCLTPENLTEPWILYEAGALSTKVTDRVWTLLLDVGHAAVPAPLTGFNHTTVEREDVLKMMKSIRKTMVAADEKTCSEADLDKYFSAFWSEDLGPKIDELRSQEQVGRKAPDPQAEVLGLLRELGELVGRTAWRQDKTLAMLHHVYQTVVGHPAPGLAELKGKPFEGLRITDHVRAALQDLSWQPQYAGTPLPLRQATTSAQSGTVVVEPLAPPAVTDASDPSE